MPKNLISILVVDDEEDLCENLSDILQDLGYEVATAQSGETALELIRKKAFDIALLDLKMPGMDGLTLSREIRQLRSDIVAIIVTAYASTGTAEAALQTGAWQVLSKPVDLSEMFSLIEHVARQPLVMIVDDDRDLCDNLLDLLRAQGYRVCLAHTEHEAEERFFEHRYHVVLVDLKLPGGNGRNVISRIQFRDPDARTVVITGYPEEVNQLRSLTGKVDVDFICYKPFDIPWLLRKIGELAASNSENR